MIGQTAREFIIEQMPRIRALSELRHDLLERISFDVDHTGMLEETLYKIESGQVIVGNNPQNGIFVFIL